MTRVAVIGVGQMGQHHARVYAGLEGVEFVGVCDVDRERADLVAARYHTTAYYDYREILSQVEAVSVAVPTDYHAVIGTQALRQGVSVLVEKPISQTLDEADRLIETAAKSRAVLQVGHLERFNPAVQALGAVVTRPRFFEAHRLGVFSPRSLDIDAVRDLMIHDLDVILSLLDSEVVHVSAVGIPVLSPQVDIANARLEFADGCVANITASRISQEKVRKLRFFQPNDYVSLDYTRQEVELFTLVESPHPAALPEIRRHLLRVEKYEPLKAQIESFLQCVRKEADPVINGAQGRRVLALALEVMEKIKEQSGRSRMDLSLP